MDSLLDSGDDRGDEYGSAKQAHPTEKVKFSIGVYFKNTIKPTTQCSTHLPEATLLLPPPIMADLQALREKGDKQPHDSANYVPQAMR